MKKIVIMLAFMAAIGCALAGPSVNPSSWSSGEIVGHTFELIATNQVEVFTFTTNGTVLATVGTQEAVTGPAMSWTIIPRGILVVKDDSMQVALQKVSFTTNTVEVLRNEKPATYKVTKTE